MLDELIIDDRRTEPAFIVLREPHRDPDALLHHALEMLSSAPRVLMRPMSSPATWATTARSRTSRVVLNGQSIFSDPPLTTNPSGPYSTVSARSATLADLDEGPELVDQRPDLSRRLLLPTGTEHRRRSGGVATDTATSDR
ncbi:MAG: hypothetical protein R3F65_20510 [bacterium]